MANPTYISGEYVASGGNATIPSNCDLVVAGYASGAPSIGGVAMVDCSGSSGMYYKIYPPKGVKAVSGANVFLLYFYDGSGGLTDADGGYNAGGLYQVTETCPATGMVVGRAVGSVGGIANIIINIGGATATSVWTSGLTRVGYTILGAANPACEARDNGAAGTVTGGFASFDYGLTGGQFIRWSNE